MVTGDAMKMFVITRSQTIWTAPSLAAIHHRVLGGENKGSRWWVASGVTGDASGVDWAEASRQGAMAMATNGDTREQERASNADLQQPGDEDARSMVELPNLRWGGKSPGTRRGYSGSRKTQPPVNPRVTRVEPWPSMYSGLDRAARAAARVATSALELEVLPTLGCRGVAADEKPAGDFAITAPAATSARTSSSRVASGLDHPRPRWHGLGPTAARPGGWPARRPSASTRLGHGRGSLQTRCSGAWRVSRSAAA